MSQKIHTPEEEIDLGNFLNQIGKLFSKLFRAIGRIFKWVYHLLILTLIFAKNHFFKLAIALVIGVAASVLFNKYGAKTYHYDMVLEPIFDGAYQLESKVKYYNQLIDNKNHNTLSKLFGITDNDAQSLLKFSITPKEDAKDKIERYDKFIIDKDSLTKTNVNFDNINDTKNTFYTSKRFLVSVKINQLTLSKNIQKELVSDLENNEHLKFQQEKEMERLNEQEKNIRKLIQDIDSTRSSDKLIALTAAKNSGLSGTKIDFSKESSNEIKDIEMFTLFKRAVEDITRIQSDREKYSHIYKIVTPLQPLGKTNNYYFVLFPLISLLLMSGYILRKPFFDYLDRYKK